MLEKKKYRNLFKRIQSQIMRAKKIPLKTFMIRIQIDVDFP